MRQHPRPLGSLGTKIFVALLAGILFVFVGFWFLVLWNTYPAEERALQAALADEELSLVENSKYFVLTPVSMKNTFMPIIFYPGGLVDPQAYLYKMGKIALLLEAEVYIIKAPFNVSIFDIHAAKRIMERYGMEKAWIGGHSLGGITAGRFVEAHPEKAFGLFLLGSYADRNLEEFEGPVFSIMGMEDFVIRRSNYENSKANLPPTARIVEIEGMNHADFGNYGPQRRDGKSSLSDDEVLEHMYSGFEKMTTTGLK